MKFRHILSRQSICIRIKKTNKIKPNEKNQNTFILQKNWLIITPSGEEPPSKYQIHRNVPSRPKKSKKHW